MKRYGVDSAHSVMLAVTATFVQLTTVGWTIGAAGVLYKAFLDVQQATEEEASWPTSIQSGMAIVAGPVTTLLSTKLSIRVLMSIAVLLQVLGHCACFFSTNLVFACLFYGALSGLGMNMAPILLPVLITRVFKKYRVTAMGIVATGFSLGGLIAPFTTSAMLQSYGLNGTFLMLGAVYMQAFLGTILLVEYEIDNRQNTWGKVNLREKVETENMLKDFSEETNKGKKLNSTDFNTATFDVKAEITEISYKIDKSEEINEKPSLSFEASTDAASKEEGKVNDSKPNSVMARVVNLLKMPGFYLCTATQNMSFLLNFLYSLVILDYATRKNVSYSKALTLLLTYSIGQIVGRLALGRLSDKNLISKTMNSSIHYCLMAVLFFLLPFVFPFEWLMVITVLYSILMGNLAPMSMVIFADYVPREKMILAMSMSRIFGGTLLLLRSTLIGALTDDKSSYDRLFFFMGSLAMVACLTMLTETVGKKIQNIKHKRLEDRKIQPVA